MAQTPVIMADGRERIGPVSPSERIPVIDILHGFALFGILLVNIGVGVFSYPFGMRQQLFTGTADRAAFALIEFFAEGKFYTLFSFLFGLGFAIQMSRAEAHGRGLVPLYRRRLFVLLLIGLVHASFVWRGDILRDYALLGFVLLLFRACSPKNLLRLAVFSLLIPMTYFSIRVGLREARQPQTPTTQAVAAQPPQAAGQVSARAQETLRIYSQGTYQEMVTRRTRDFVEDFSSLDYYFTWTMPIFPMFLLGLYAGRRRIFEDLSTHLPFIRKVFWWGLVLGLAGNFLWFFVVRPLIPGNPTIGRTTFTGILGSVSWRVGQPALCFFYASAIILLVQRAAWKARLTPLAAVGRMALTNYLLQSVICTTIFYSYGLGLYGKAGPAICAVFAVLIFTLQIPLSQWWLRHFQFGPAEWLWRSLTYARLQPMRIADFPGLPSVPQTR